MKKDSFQKFLFLNEPLYFFSTRKASRSRFAENRSRKMPYLTWRENIFKKNCFFRHENQLCLVKVAKCDLSGRDRDSFERENKLKTVENPELPWSFEIFRKKYDQKQNFRENENFTFRESFRLIWDLQLFRRASIAPPSEKRNRLNSNFVCSSFPNERKLTISMSKELTYFFRFNLSSTSINSSPKERAQNQMLVVNRWDVPYWCWFSEEFLSIKIDPIFQRLDNFRLNNFSSVKMKSSTNSSTESAAELTEDLCRDFFERDEKSSENRRKNFDPKTFPVFCSKSSWIRTSVLFLLFVRLESRRSTIPVDQQKENQFLVERCRFELRWEKFKLNFDQSAFAKEKAILLSCSTTSEPSEHLTKMNQRSVSQQSQMKMVEMRINFRIFLKS